VPKKVSNNRFEKPPKLPNFGEIKGRDLKLMGFRRNNALQSTPQKRRKSKYTKIRQRMLNPSLYRTKLSKLLLSKTLQQKGWNTCHIRL